MTASDHILSVTELNRRARQLLEVHLPTVWVRGEISNLSTPTSGHWYFTLKDEKAQVRCAMFRGHNALLRFRPEHGMQVIARGRISLYEGRGDYQLIAEHLTPDGAGNLQIAFEQLKTRLADEGLFDAIHKQALPDMPQHIGVITSPTGSVVRDIITTFRRRFPAIVLSILPVPVQGVEAAPAIVAALQRANRFPSINAIILARGGGSLEDLQAFNDESVARAIFASRLPVVSAVGHETDFTISDFVADVRAATPTAAAELLSPDVAATQLLLVRQTTRLIQGLRNTLQQARGELLTLIQRLRHPTHLLREQQQRLDHLEWRLGKGEQQLQMQRQQQLTQLNARLLRNHPQQRLQQLQSRLQLHRQRLLHAMSHRMEIQQQHLAHLSALLDSVSPLDTLRRGYAIVHDPQQHTVTRVFNLRTGQRITVRLQDGELDCTVQSITALPPRD